MSSLPRLALLLVALLPLATCAGGGTPGESAGTSATVGNSAYETALQHWVDRSEEDLISAWGVPERSQRITDGGQALEYRRLDAAGKLVCSTLFTSDLYGKIRTWTYRGTDCRAPLLGDYSGQP
jgi:hypothetical protein